MSFEEHITSITKKANQILGVMWRSFEYIDKEVILLLYKSVIHPHLEYAAPIWSPHTWKLVEMIEKVQRRATKWVLGICDLSFEDRLRYLKLPTLVYH